MLPICLLIPIVASCLSDNGCPGMTSSLAILITDVAAGAGLAAGAAGAGLAAAGAAGAAAAGAAATGAAATGAAGARPAAAAAAAAASAHCLISAALAGGAVLAVAAAGAAGAAAGAPAGAGLAGAARLFLRVAIRSALFSFSSLTLLISSSTVFLRPNLPRLVAGSLPANNISAFSLLRFPRRSTSTRFISSSLLNSP